jgi:hypothetical protein
MSRMKLALNVVEDLRSLADSIETLAKSVTDTNDAEVEEERKPEVPKIKFEDLRAVLTVLTRSGKQAKVKELITKYGAKKLSEVPEEKYQELLDAAREIQ